MWKSKFCFSTITIFDDAAPKITINHPLLGQMDQMTMGFDCNSGGLPAWFMDLDESSVIAIDFCSNDVALNFEMIEELSQQCQGSGYLEKYTFIWTATDGCGNASSLEFIALVTDSVAPVVENIAEQLCLEDATVANLDYYDACSAAYVSFEDQQIETACGTGKAIQRTWLIQDECGNSTSFDQTILLDSVAPELILNIEAVNAFNKFDVYAIDECGVDPFILFSKTFKSYENCEDGVIGKLSISWIALDACGNESELNVGILIIDDIAPELENIPEDLTIICDEVPNATVTAQDNNSDVVIDLVEQIINSNTPGNYIIIRTWTATDECGNAASDSQTIDVINDAGLSCDIEIPNIVNCNSHNNIAIVNTIGLTGPYTYEWSVQGGDCLIETGASNDTMTFYQGFGDITLNVIITDINGCSTSCSIEIECQDKAQALTQSTTTGQWVSNITTYPNPVSDDLTVQLNSNAADHIEEIFIVNALGQIVKRENINLLKGKNIFRMDTYAIPNGIYFIQFSDSIIDQQTIKFIKN